MMLALAIVVVVVSLLALVLLARSGSGGYTCCPSCGAFVKAPDIRSEPQAYGSAIELFDSQRPVGSATINSRGSKASRPRPYTLRMCSRCDPMRNGAVENWEAEREAGDARAREEADQEERERAERWAREDAARRGGQS